MRYAKDSIRENLTLVGKAIEAVDDLTNAIAEARWRFEMVNREPALGKVQGKVFTPDDFRRNIDNLTQEKEVAIKALCYLTNTETVEEARLLYMHHLHAYQTVGNIHEHMSLKKAGHDEAKDKSEDDLMKALNRLEETAIEIPAPSKIMGIGSAIR